MEGFKAYSDIKWIRYEYCRPLIMLTLLMHMHVAMFSPASQSRLRLSHVMHAITSCVYNRSHFIAMSHFLIAF